MLVIWTNKDGKTREGLTAKNGEVIKGKSFKKDEESFAGGVIFGDLETSLVHSLHADRLFVVEPLGKRTRILLEAKPTKIKKVKILWLFKAEKVLEEKKIYGNLWKAKKVRIVRELEVAPFLRTLANNPDYWVRRAVAENLHAELEVLRKLSSDQNGLVLTSLALNPKAEEEILKKLCHCSEPVARAIAIKRSSLDLAALKEMEAQETEAMVIYAIRDKIKTHKNTPVLSRVALTLSGW